MSVHMPDFKTIVVALGGNAISLPDEEGRVSQQFSNSRRAAEPLVDLIEQGYQLVITHGNGPQIGNFLLRNDAAADAIYPLPMEVAVAHVQGGMGFMLAHIITNELHSRGINRNVTAVITTVVVESDDPSFDKPTKPIGRPMPEADLSKLPSQAEWALKEVAPGRFRRLVASPKPVQIIEMDHIRRTVEAGELLVVCGGGGIPVIKSKGQGFVGVRAVIDKDLASSLLATQLNADAMMILTNVERVSIHYGQEDECALDKMTTSEARRWLEEGQFPPGSMGPKIEAAISFVENADHADATAYIGPLFRAVDVLAGRVGTRITKDS